MFFSHHWENSIEFWKCSNQCKWSLHKVVAIEIKSFSLILLFPSKLSWDFSKKNKCDDLVNRWKITFQTSDMKGKHFLNLVDNDNNTIEPSYIKGGSWLKYLSHFNSLCTRASRATTNHAPISEYRLWFFPRKEFSCPCRQYPIETRCHILYECKRFNKYWNPRRDSIGYFIIFLELNPNMFAFPKPIT